MSYTLEHHLAYSVWANEIFIERLKKLDEPLFHQEVKSSFPSIFKTLLHIWDAEYIWLKRLQGVSIASWPPKEFNGTTTDLLNGVIESSRGLYAFIKTQKEDFVSGTVRYKNTKGTEFEDSVEYILYHVVNHGTYHRGQITTMLRSLGVTDLASTDIIFYWRSLRNNA